jgi:hypothetical protein
VLHQGALALLLRGDALLRQADGAIPGAEDGGDAALFGEGGKWDCDLQERRFGNLYHALATAHRYLLYCGTTHI